MSAGAATNESTSFNYIQLVRPIKVPFYFFGQATRRQKRTEQGSAPAVVNVAPNDLGTHCGAHAEAGSAIAVASKL
jgi:hypothetical protein